MRSILIVPCIPMSRNELEVEVKRIIAVVKRNVKTLHVV